MSSFGEDIRRERELRRITLREVAESTKITLRYLEALEKNEFDQLPGGVFNRGFVRAYAEFIGVDPESMVTAYLLEVQTRSGSGGEISDRDAGAMRRGDRARGHDSTHAMDSGGGLPAWSKWLLALVAFAILVLGGIYLFQRMSGTGDGSAPASNEPTGQSSATLPTTPHPVASPPTATETADTDEGSGAGDDRPSTNPPATQAPSAVSAVILVDRATTGRVNCDNLQIETLDGALGGTQLRMDCSRFLIFDAADAGAIRLALAGNPPQPLGNDGDSLVGYRVDVAPIETESTAVNR